MKRLITLLLFIFSISQLSAQVTVSNLRCEMLQNPQGIDVKQPRLSWQLQSNLRNVQQSAYQILLASSAEQLNANKGDVWDSGKINSGQSVLINYAGKALAAKSPYFWKVKVYTNQGEVWSQPAQFSTGIFYKVDWKGRWIGMDKAFAWESVSQWSKLSARYLRKEFKSEKTVKRAMVYLMGMGLYELYLNGNKVGDAVLAPVPTDYFQQVNYNTYDVTAQIQSGKNTIGTILGNGRYFTMRQDFKPYKIKNFGFPKLLLNLEIEYTDGSRESISTDESWKLNADGPIRSNNEYDGEEYDARKEFLNWSKPGFDDSKWMNAEFVQEPGGKYAAQMTPNMKVMETIKPLSVKLLKPGVYILDMGQNMAGWLKMQMKGSAGTQVNLKFAETLKEDGSLFTRNLRDAQSTDTYILKGGETETWEPRFVYHGFRYVEISGFPGTPTIHNFEGRVVYDDLSTSGSFSSSNPVLNQVYQNAYWGIRANYKGMPVDCPQRNERQPWLGDRTVGAYGESFLFNNATLYAKWLDDIQQSQNSDGAIPDVAPAFWNYYSDNVTWPSTYITIADMMYQQFGDLVSVNKHYPSMKKWMEYMASKYSKNGLVVKDKFADWCLPPESKELIHSKDPARQTSGELIAASTYIHMLQLMQQFAVLLNKPEDARAFEAQRESMKATFNQRFYNPKGYYDNNTITANLLALAYDIVDPANRSKLEESIVNKILIDNKGSISTGVIGTQLLMRSLTAMGRADIAYKLATNTSYPSWGYMAANGATTIWELWNGNTANPEMNSQNHVMLLGDLMIWYYEHLAGIRSDKSQVAFKKIIMNPENIAGLDRVSASYESAYGKIVSNWKKENAAFNWDITIPANTTAEVYLPAKKQSQVRVNGKKDTDVQDLQFIRQEGEKLVYQISSGQYSFQIK